MPREATNEYIGMKRRANQAASREKRREILIEVCIGGYSRGYAISLLSGSEKFREREGHGKKFGEEVAKWLKAVWFDAGCIRQGGHGVQRQAWRHPDGHICALRRLDNGQLLLDTQGDRPQDAVDAHLARMEPWQGDAPLNRSVKSPRPLPSRSGRCIPTTKESR